ncbi:MAG: DUF4091 domain-containing protein [Clostridia bacterium]|nr:DUF4091 domain-containing protein [Clostridia bacterium]
MKKLFKSILALSLTAMVGGGVAGCSDSSNAKDGESGSSAKTAVWTAYGTEKILADVDYSDRHDEKTLQIKAFRNEYESAQIILTPNKDVKAYSIELSDLTCGENVLSKDAFTVYNQKYVLVDSIKDNNVTTGAGYYPDALLPFEAAVKYGENEIDGGKNQGIWLTLHTEDTQEAGTYTGNFAVIMDGTKYDVPVSVTVFDYTLSDTVHSKSSFLINAEEMAVGELDSTDEMIETYHDFLLDFRISPNHLPGNDFYALLKDEKLEAFLDSAVKATLDPRCSNYNITYMDSSAVVDVDGVRSSIQTVDFVTFEKTLIAMAERSVQEKANLFKKAQTYIVFLDEYDYNNRIVEANYNLQKLDELCKQVAADLEETLVCDDADFKAELLQDLAKIRHKLVGSLNADLTSKATMVPTLDKYHTEAIRQQYEQWAEKWYGEDAELWTYTAMDPDPPHPTYHTEDVLISSRLMGWMMYNYNIVGNLYWNTTLYTYSDGYNTMGQIQDYYDTALRFWRSNGDGYLMYPGRPYGIYGPVGTVRLHSIRDGNEDYDLLYALEEIYQERGVSGDDFDTVLHYLVQDLYTGTQCNTSADVNELLIKSRELLAQLLVLAEKGVVLERAAIEGITGENNEKYNAVTFTVSAVEGTTIKADGKALTPVVENGISVYTVKADLLNAENALTLTVGVDGADYALGLNLGAGGKVRTEDRALVEMLSEVSVNNAQMESAQIDGTAAIKLSGAAATYRADINVSKLAIDNSVKTVTLRVYAEEAGSTMRVLYQCTKDSALIAALEGYELQQGWNEITLEVSAFNCDQDEILQKLRVAFTANGTQGAIYLANLAWEVAL